MYREGACWNEAACSVRVVFLPLRTTIHSHTRICCLAAVHPTCLLPPPFPPPTHTCTGGGRAAGSGAGVVPAHAAGRGVLPGLCGGVLRAVRRRLGAAGCGLGAGGWGLEAGGWRLGAGGWGLGAGGWGLGAEERRQWRGAGGWREAVGMDGFRALVSGIRGGAMQRRSHATEPAERQGMCRGASQLRCLLYTVQCYSAI